LDGAGADAGEMTEIKNRNELEMSIFKKDIQKRGWPLRFDSFSFGARAYNTLRAVVIFDNKHQLSENAELSPTGEPYAPNWKDDWKAGHSISSDRVFPAPAKVRWTSLDGIERSTEIDLETIFPEHLILHEVAQDDVDEFFGQHPVERMVDIFLEINDATVNVYMRSWVRTRHLVDPAIPDGKRISHQKLILAWTKTY
jgi:hypothetical protein